MYHSSDTYMVKIMEKRKRLQHEVDRVKELFKLADEERRLKRFEKKRQSRL